MTGIAEPDLQATTQAGDQAAWCLAALALAAGASISADDADPSRGSSHHHRQGT